MGCFSWMFCNTKNRRLKIGRPGYLLTPDGGYIKEESYDGYGNFGGKDVYALVAEWNRPFLNTNMLIRPLISEYPLEEYYERAMRRYTLQCQRLNDYASFKLSDEEMNKKYGFDWKRNIGIDIACQDEQNESLPYPIKIASCKKDYSKMPASKDDPYQGL